MTDSITITGRVSPTLLSVNDDDHPDRRPSDACSTQGVYLELPMVTRRRRSTQYYQQSDLEDKRERKESAFSYIEDQHKVDFAQDDDVFDSPRLFTEMVTLTDTDEDAVPIWREASRWVRFEEDVDADGMRWTKPRVSTLSVHSFFELRALMMQGVIDLSASAKNYSSIVELMGNHWQRSSKFKPETINSIKEIMNKKCRHLYQKNENGLFKKKDACPKNYEGNTAFQKKLPEGTEGANVFIAEVGFVESLVCVFLRLEDAVDLGRVTEVAIPTRFIFLLIGPRGELGRYYEIGRCISTLLSDEVFREVAYKAQNKSHVISGIDEFLDASTMLPPGEWDPSIRIEPPEVCPTKESRRKDPTECEHDEQEIESRDREAAGLVRTGRLFGGLINDLKRKKPFYISDFTNGISMQSLASFFFLYFACLTPIITFGGLLGDATGGNIAVMESLVSGLICGVIYGLFSGQPLTILGSTGPVLVFESILYDFCRSVEWDYLSFRMLIGLWATLILLVLVAVDASAAVCYITRFTEENFATLIAFIFIWKAIEKLLKISHYDPQHSTVEPESLLLNGELDGMAINLSSPFSGIIVDNETFEPTFRILDNSTLLVDAVNQSSGHLPGSEYDHGVGGNSEVFLLSVLLFFGTFIISRVLKDFKTTPFFSTKVRGFISDFAVLIAIVSMTGVDLYSGIATPKLHVPNTFKPTSPNRGWIIPPFNGNPWWSAPLAFIPATLVCILLFMDQQITAVIVNRKEHKLMKGGGFHLDLAVLSVLVCVTSVMGLPWFVAATVLSINHVSSLRLESNCAAPGEKPQFLGVRENRLTHVVIFLTIGLSVLMTSVLQMIPMAVLYGVFLYMGISALTGIQFFDRILIMFMPEKYQPDSAFLKNIPLSRVHLYTAIQIVCLVVLWVIKSFKQTSILFPLMLVVIVGVRKLLEWVFTQRELKILDDALPEFTRKEKIESEEEKEGHDGDADSSDPASIPLINGAKLYVPPPTINITDEVKNSTLWKQINSNVRAYSGDASRRSSGAPPFSDWDQRRTSSKTFPHGIPQIMLTVPGSAGSSRRVSIASINRRRSSILGPIFGAAHNYNVITEENSTGLSIPVPHI